MEKQEVDININITVSPDGSKHVSADQNAPPPTEKIRISFSVAQVAYIFRVLTEMGVIKNKNVSEVIRFAITNISTPKAENISFDSFKLKYYNADYSTKQFFHDFLIKQLNYIRKELKQ